MNPSLTLCLSLLLAARPAFAQNAPETPPAQASPAEAQRPIFRGGAELVAVDVTVVDDKGKPVIGLERDEFVLEVDGKPRPLASAEFISRQMPESVASVQSIASGWPSCPTGATSSSRPTARRSAPA
jgi:hypothetical protein